MITTVIPRRVVPISGTWFNARVTLVQLIRELAEKGGDIEIPFHAAVSPVSVWISVLKSGGKLVPFIRIGSMESEAIEMRSMWAAGLHQDYGLDPENRLDDCWVYTPWDVDKDGNEDATTYYCDKCEQQLFKDDSGRRESRSACLDSSGKRICRTCEAVGPIYDHKTEKHMEKCRRLADAIGPECREKLDRDIEHICDGMWFGRSSQNHVYKDGDYSFGWHMTRDGELCMNGGLILHTGRIEPKDTEDGFEFEYYDWSSKERRPATAEEIGTIRWSIHT